MALDCLEIDPNTHMLDHTEIYATDCDIVEAYEARQQEAYEKMQLLKQQLRNSFYFLECMLNKGFRKDMARIFLDHFPASELVTYKDQDWIDYYAVAYELVEKISFYETDKGNWIRLRDMYQDYVNICLQNNL